MIPTVIVLGLLFGRWWWQTILAGAVGWPLLLLADGVPGADAVLAQAAGLGAVNAAAGVLVHQAILRLVRRIRSIGQTRRSEDNAKNRPR